MAVSTPPSPNLHQPTLDHVPSIASSRTGRLIVFTGPSGVGKGTLLKALRERYPSLGLSISATTRSPRPGEVDGKDYYFVSREQFQAMVDNGDLLEWAEFAGNFYGTPKAAVQRHLEEGEWLILEIELEGARQVRHTFPQALQLFVLPPSLDELEQRIRLRGKDSEDAIVRRMARAQVEIDAAPEFDVQIINDDLETALQQLETAIFDQ
ncbi:guanylate kinase [Leptolyngbya sp. BL0902]|uniref:guanylate kinase n=1 Tax=Leptolyngbya sp. BL0902 TaxID=1115757 RepID=UPI0018E7519C|nr:guanylate kinase [Leptolyngbya sp. BL0902]QQE65542.1 guanylate kinase [Leptolyngbya sp. BL0902]